MVKSVIGKTRSKAARPAKVEQYGNVTVTKQNGIITLTFPNSRVIAECPKEYASLWR